MVSPINPVVPRWARAKMRKKKPYSYWGKNPQGVNTSQPRMLTMSYKDEFGNTVLYRDHNRSQGTVKADAHFGDDLVTKHHKITTEHKYNGYPLGVIVLLDMFKNMKEEDLPPMISVMRQRKELWQGTSRQGKDRWYCITLFESKLKHLFCFVSGKTSYYVWVNHVKRELKKSCLYSTDISRDIWRKMEEDYSFDPIQFLRWVEKVKIPD